MAQQTKLGKHMTTITGDVDGFTRITYHKTVIIKYNHERIVLNSGGWKTSTTKTRMNQASVQFSLGFQVSQRKNTWYVTLPDDKEVVFFDGMIIPRNTILNQKLGKGKSNCADWKNIGNSL